jgi:hypothetical protein
MTEEQLLEEAKAALARSYLEQVILPIYLERDSGDMEGRGTGTLLEVGDKLCLITASHVFDGCNPTKLSSPWGRKKAQIVTWGEFRLRRAPEGSALPDVAIAELQSPETIAAFRANYRPITIEQAAMPTLGPGYGSPHVLAGFPSEMATMTETTIDQDPLVYFTKMLAEPPPDEDLKEVWNPTFDLSFALERRVRVLGPARQVVEMPNLQGASGSIIWEMSSVDGLWTPDKALKAVGVQRSALRGKWFRATNWLAVVPLLAPIDERAALQLAIGLIGEERAGELFRAAGYEIVA